VNMQMGKSAKEERCIVSDPEGLQQAILQRLSSVIDPETGVDVVRMRLIEALGDVRYTFRPSSPLCPIAVFLVMRIKAAVAEVPGVKQQTIQVAGYVQAEELTELINELAPVAQGDETSSHRRPNRGKDED
jgi:metal-sulfur cluster biosynthetic enzyme